MKKIYELENGTILDETQLKGKLYRTMDINNKSTYYYTDNLSDIKGDSKVKREKAINNLQKIRVVPYSRKVMTDLFNSLKDKNDLVYTNNFYNYINRVVASANTKLLRYYSEEIPYDDLNDVKSFFIIDIFNTMTLDDEEINIDFNNYNMDDLHFLLHKIATKELNARYYKLFRDISIDKDIYNMLENDLQVTILTQLDRDLHFENIEYQTQQERKAELMEMVKEIATPTQLETFKIAIAKKQYEQSTTYEERQKMTEQQKQMTYKLTAKERSNFRHLMKRINE